MTDQYKSKLDIMNYAADCLDQFIAGLRYLSTNYRAWVIDNDPDPRLRRFRVAATSLYLSAYIHHEGWNSLESWRAR